MAYDRHPQTRAHGSNLTRCLFVYIRLYWNTAIPICLCINEHFHNTMAELSGCNRDHVATMPKIFIAWAFTKETANPWHKIDIIEDHKTATTKGLPNMPLVPVGLSFPLVFLSPATNSKEESSAFPSMGD